VQANKCKETCARKECAAAAAWWLAAELTSFVGFIICCCLIDLSALLTVCNMLYQLLWLLHPPAAAALTTTTAAHRVRMGIDASAVHNHAQQHCCDCTECCSCCNRFLLLLSWVLLHWLLLRWLLFELATAAHRVRMGIDVSAVLNHVQQHCCDCTNCWLLQPPPCCCAGYCCAPCAYGHALPRLQVPLR
jgi:hypothetical protein